MRKSKESLLQKIKRKRNELYEEGRIRAEEIKKMKTQAEKEKEE